jgi:hypothetical protein
MSSHRDNPDQIPTEYNEEKTFRIIRRQSVIPGEGRSKTISDFPKTAALAQVLKNLNFPAEKKRILQFAYQSNSLERYEILPTLNRIEERNYSNVFDVARAASLVSGSD